MPIQLDGTTGISTTGNIISNGTITATNIALNNINTAGNVSAAGNITAGGSLTVGSFAAAALSTSGNVTGGNLITAGAVGAASVSASANINGGNINTGAQVVATGNITGGNINTGGLVSSAGNVSGGNLITGGAVSAASVSASANITGDNVLAGGSISTTGNVTGNYILGNGALLTGVITSVANINSGTSNVTVVSSGGNVTVGIGGTGNVAVFATTGEYVTGLISASGNVTGGNLITAAAVSAASVSASGNITGGNILGGANVNATTHTGATVSVTGNITGSYFLGNGSALTGIDATSIQNGTSNVKVVSSGGNVTVSVGGTGNVAVFNTGGMSVTANVTGGNLITAGAISAASVSASGNITGGNVIVGNLVFSTDTISSQDGTITIDPAAVGVTGLVIIQGNLQVNGNTTTINSNVVSTNDLTYNLANNAVNSAAANGGGIEVGPIGSPYITWLYDSTANVFTSSGGVSAVGNVTGGNLITAGAVTATGNITGGNLSVGTGTLSGGNIVNTNANGVGNIGSATVYYNTVFAKATSAQYADLAEWYEADADYAPGTVLVFGGDREVTVANSPGDTRIAGVVSTNPAYNMNSGLKAPHVAAVALTGRVPTKVTGSVSKGDMMIAAGNGHAHACATPVVGTVIGKALENFDGESGVIEVVVGVR